MSYLWKANRSLHNMAIDYAKRFGITDSAILVHLVVLKSCLAKFDYDYRRVQLYRDGRRTMIAYRLDNLILAKKRLWPTVDEVLQHVPSN